MLKTFKATLTVYRSRMILLNMTQEMCSTNKKVKINELGAALKAGSGIKCDFGNQVTNLYFFPNCEINWILNHLKYSQCDNDRRILKLSKTSKKFLGLTAGEEIQIRNEIAHDSGSSCFEAILLVKRI